MAFSIGFEPYGAIGTAANAIGFSQFVEKQRQEEERRRIAESELAMRAQEMRSKIEQDAFNRAMQQAELGGRRRLGGGQRLQPGQSSRLLAAGRSAQREQNAAVLLDRQMVLDSEQQQARQEAEAEAAADRFKQASITERQMMQGQMTADAQLRNKLIGQDLPEHVRIGLDQGMLRYSEQQKAEMAKIQDSLRAARQDRTLTPAELMAFQAQQQAAYQSIADSPLPVPEDERPVPLPEQFNRETTEIPGLPGRWQREVRNGVAKWTAVAMPEDPRLEQSELVAAEAEDIREDVKARRVEARQSHQFQANFQAKILEKTYEQQLAALKTTQPERDEDKYKTGKTDDAGNQTINEAAFQADTAAWETKATALYDNYMEKLRAYGEMPAQIREPIPAQIPVTPGQMPTQSMPPEAAAPPQLTDPDGTVRAVVNSEAEAIQYGLPDGTPIIDSNGRRGVYRSN